MLIGLIIEVGHILTGNLLMTTQVIICSISNTPKLAPAEREQELKVCRCLRIEGKLCLLMVSCTKHLFRHTEGQEPVLTELLPVCEPFKISVRLAEKLKLHLLELTRTEREVARGDFITERLTNLTDTKRQLLTRRSLDILEVYKDALCGLRTEIYGILCILGDTLEGLEHQVKLTDTGEIMLTAGRTRNLMLLDEAFHLLVGPAVCRAADVDPVLSRIILDQLIGSETLVALLTIHQRIREGSEMSRSNPRLRIHEDRAVNAYIIF